MEGKPCGPERKGDFPKVSQPLKSQMGWDLRPLLSEGGPARYIEL